MRVTAEMQWREERDRTLGWPGRQGGPLRRIGMSSKISLSKFAGILSAALSQHRLSGFGIAQLEFHH